MTPRRAQVERLFEEGKQALWKLGLVMFYADDFHEKLQCRTGLTDGARGGLNRKYEPCIYIGTRGAGFDKKRDLEKYKKHRRDPSPMWRHVAAHARAGAWVCIEYSHIFDDPEIGAFISDQSDDHIRSIVAHELAHAVHHWDRKHGGGLKGKPHGEAWRSIYRALRVNWVNPKIKA